MNTNIYSIGNTPLLRIRYLGCNILPDTVSIGPLKRYSYIVHFVICGKGYYNGREVRAGQGFLIGPGKTARYVPDPKDPWELLWFVSEDPEMGNLFPVFHADDESGVFEFPFLQELENTRKSVQEMEGAFFVPSVLLELFLKLYRHLEESGIRRREQPRTKEYVESAKDYIRTNLQDTVTVERLAGLLGVSQPYLYRIFKEETGLSPKRYLSSRRILEAEKRLEETELTVSEIAETVGYRDSLAFSRFFTKEVGISPSAFRKLMRSNGSRTETAE